MARHSLRFDRGELQTRALQILDSLGLTPRSPDLYVLAFIHRSVLNESTLGYIESNERLEFLGDAVLELVITDCLFRDFPEAPEGKLTDIRSALVRGRNLAEIASHLGYSHAIQLSRGEHLAAGHENPYILANTFEAVLGAIYLDLGMEVVRAFITTHVYGTLESILHKGLYVDPKSYLQEVTQGIWGQTPLYRVVDEEGQDHNKMYLVEASLDGIVLGTGRGSSKKKGEQEAAENALNQQDEWRQSIILPKKLAGEKKK